MAGMRFEVPRHAEKRGKMVQRFFESRQAALLPAGIDSADGQSVREEAKEERKQSGGGGELTQRRVTHPTLDSAGGESWTRKEAEEEEGKRSEMAGMRFEVPRHAEKKGKMVRKRRGNENFASKEAALLPAGMDSADGQSVRKEAKEESGKISEMHYEWEKRPEESDASYENRLRLMPNEEEESGKISEMHYEWEKRPEESDASYENRLRLMPNEDTSRRQRETNSKEKARTTPKVEAKDAEEEAGKKAQPPPATDAGEPQESGKAGESVTLDRLKFVTARRQQKTSSKEKARTKPKVEAKDAEAGKGLEEDSNRKTEPAADPSSTTVQDDHVDPGKSALAEKTADDEIKAYFSYRKSWESFCCGDNCDHFDQRTTLSSMQYAHCMPDMLQLSYAKTLQVFSMKLKFTEGNAGDFKLPLYVYGTVAVRDILDSRRNILFSCNRTMAQELTQDDPFLLLTGPSRAILSEDMVYFEIHLKVKRASQDQPVITCVHRYDGGSNTALCFNNVMCTLEVCLREVKEAVQATIMCVQIVKKHKLWPSNFAYGGRIACTPLPRTTDIDGDQKIVLVESKGREFPQGYSGYVRLRSQVVSVEVEGELAVVIQTYEKSGAVAEERCIRFKAQNCQVFQKHCFVGQAQVNVTVAWSDVPTNMNDVVYGD